MTSLASHPDIITYFTRLVGEPVPKRIALGDPERTAALTTGGLILDRLGHLPRVGEVLEVAGHRFEVVDLDGRRIDRVMVTPWEGGEPGQSAPPPL